MPGGRNASFLRWTSIQSGESRNTPSIKGSSSQNSRKLVFSDEVCLLFVLQILLLVVFMCMSLSFASFLSLTGPGELWKHLYTQKTEESTLDTLVSVLVKIIIIITVCLLPTWRKKLMCQLRSVLSTLSRGKRNVWESTCFWLTIITGLVHGNDFDAKLIHCLNLFSVVRIHSVFNKS